jgi:hypothetical protein
VAAFAFAARPARATIALRRSEHLMTQAEAQSLNESLQILVGETLSSVTFVMDYWQLHFDGPFFNVYSRIAVTGADWSVQSPDPGFRDRLCEQIAKTVRSAEFNDGQGVRISFEDGSALELSTRPEDYTCAEAVLFQGPNLQWWVV